MVWDCAIKWSIKQLYICGTWPQALWNLCCFWGGHGAHHLNLIWAWICVVVVFLFCFLYMCVCTFCSALWLRPWPLFVYSRFRTLKGRKVVWPNKRRSWGSILVSYSHVGGEASVIKNLPQCPVLCLTAHSCWLLVTGKNTVSEAFYLS